jgi:hypothetical protein
LLVALASVPPASCAKVRAYQFYVIDAHVSEVITFQSDG